MVGPRPESLDFAECYREAFRSVLDFTPGIFGPSQAIFRNESALYPPDVDPYEFYRTALFPSKARIDLSYFPTQTILSDIGWIFRCVLAVLGLGAFLDADKRALVASDTQCEDLAKAEAHTAGLDGAD